MRPICSPAESMNSNNRPTPASGDAASCSLRESLLQHLHFTLAKDEFSATQHDYFVALVHAVRDRLIAGWLRTQQRYYREDRKRVYYLSMEYLIGRTLSNSLINLGLLEECVEELRDLGFGLDQLIGMEPEAGLGNGGLGRLAACLMDSMATLEIPAYGYGIRYEYGIFQQKIENGYQVEAPDNWLHFGNPWEIRRSEDQYPIQFYGYVRQLTDANGRQQFEWVGGEDVMAMAFDMPIPGYGCDTVNTLRLWSALSPHGFNLDYFNRGDYIAAVEETSRSRSISRVLYPNDNVFSGKELRLKQEYFLVSASLQDILRRYLKTRPGFEAFPEKVAIQLNDTHCALAIPELMRILVDLKQLSWERAWEITTATFGYTNHTLLPEALEEWPVALLERVLPRHLEIIYEINRRFLQVVQHQHPGDIDRLRRMSVISEAPERRVRMAHLAIIGSHAVNGVSRLHSDLLRSRIFRDFDGFFPCRFCTTTNGISPRRWLKSANPGLAELVTDCVGDGWARDLCRLDDLTEHAADPSFVGRWLEIKRANKRRLAARIRAELGIEVSPDSLFDCQVKRIHEYKRQLLNVLHVISLYNRIRDNDTAGFVPQTVIFGGKAAPGYEIARLIIKLIHSVAETVNHDPQVGELLKVVFMPNYNVSLAELIFPAVELSEQISTAGTEASGTGNMKAMLNGALTIGTLDGANIEIRDAVGDENIFIFGMTAEQVEQATAAGHDPWAPSRQSPALAQAIDMIAGGFFTSGDRTIFEPLLNSIDRQRDRFMVLADFADYAACQQRAARAYGDQTAWTQKSIINVARSGRFSSDRTALNYARNIWGLDLGGVEEDRAGGDFGPIAKVNC
jgi:glycogen phosphorylase